MTEEHLPFESELVTRIAWLIRLRWLAVIGVAVAIAVVAVRFPDALDLVPLLALTAAIALYNLQFYFTLRILRIGPAGRPRLRNAMVQAYAQIILDLGALAALIHFSGGVENPIAFFFVFHVIIASILLQRRVSYAMAGLAVLLFAAVAGLEYAGVLPHHHLPLDSQELYRQPAYVLLSVAAMAVTLAIVAYLTTSITSRLRERDRELFERTLAYQARSVELADANEQLRRMDAERTRFMVLVTHELRAPVGTIYSSLELVRGGYATPQEADEMLKRAQTRASELLELISDLLNLTRLRDKAVQRDQVSPVRLDAILRDVVEFVESDARRNGLSLEVSIAPDLAPVRAVTDQMKLVWTNLISNAIKYNRPGGKVSISLQQNDKGLIGQVSDTGIGIAPEDLPHMFEEFYRAGNAKLVSPHGTGVGLAIVRRILENWGGTISVQSELGNGTSFRFELPRADAQ